MGNYQSVEEVKRSPELRKYCYDAVDTLIKMDKQYKNDIKDIARKPPKDQNVNVGSNNMKTWNIASTSKVSLSQSIVLDTVVKTSFYTNSITALKADPYVKAIICDLVGMSNEEALEKPMPAYSDPTYLLRMLGINNVKEASFVEDDIVYKDANGINTKQPIQQIRDYVHRYYVAVLDDKMANSKNVIKNISNTISASAKNVSSNELDITIARNQDTTIEFDQSNTSVISVEAELNVVADVLTKLANSKGGTEKASTKVDTTEHKVDNKTGGTQKDNSKKDGVSGSATGELVKSKDQLGNETEKIQASLNTGLKTDNGQKVNDNMNTSIGNNNNNNTIVIIIIVVVVIIVLGILGVAVFISMQNASAAYPQPGVMYGGFGIPLNYIPITIH